MSRRSKLKKKAAKQNPRKSTRIAATIDDILSPETVVEYYVRILEGKPNVRLVQDSSSRKCSIAWDAWGEPPTMEKRDAAMRILLKRGFGQPVQMLALAEAK